MRPNIFGYQKYVAAKMAKMADTPMTMCRCPTTKYVACKYESTAGWASSTPLRPPVTNVDTKPRQNIIDVLKRSLPPQMVPSQSRVVMVAGREIRIVGTENKNAENGLMPLTNMWWPQTTKLRKAIANMHASTTLYPRIGLRVKHASRCETMPNPGRMVM